MRWKMGVGMCSRAAQGTVTRDAGTGSPPSTRSPEITQSQLGGGRGGPRQLQEDGGRGLSKEVGGWEDDRRAQ